MEIYWKQRFLSKKRCTKEKGFNFEEVSNQIPIDEKQNEFSLVRPVSNGFHSLQHRAVGFPPG